MTNKELLEDIIIDCEYYGRDKATIDIETIESIKKELEILEAIKNKAQNNRFFKGCLLRMFVEVEYKPDGAYFQTKQKIKDENYDKIMRWLDEKSD